MRLAVGGNTGDVRGARECPAEFSTGQHATSSIRDANTAGYAEECSDQLEERMVTRNNREARLPRGFDSANACRANRRGAVSGRVCHQRDRQIIFSSIVRKSVCRHSLYDVGTWRLVEGWRFAPVRLGDHPQRRDRNRIAPIGKGKYFFVVGLQVADAATSTARSERSASSRPRPARPTRPGGGGA